MANQKNWVVSSSSSTTTNGILISRMENPYRMTLRLTDGSCFRLPTTQNLEYNSSLFLFIFSYIRVYSVSQSSVVQFLSLSFTMTPVWTDKLADQPTGVSFSPQTHPGQISRRFDLNERIAKRAKSLSQAPVAAARVGHGRIDRPKGFNRMESSSELFSRFSSSSINQSSQSIGFDRTGTKRNDDRNTKQEPLTFGLGPARSDERKRISSALSEIQRREKKIRRRTRKSQLPMCDKRTKLCIDRVIFQPTKSRGFNGGCQLDSRWMSVV